MWVVLVEGIQLRIDQIHFLSTRCIFICPVEVSPLPMDVLGKLVYSLERHVGSSYQSFRETEVEVRAHLNSVLGNFVSLESIFYFLLTGLKSVDS